MKEIYGKMMKNKILKQLGTALIFLALGVWMILYCGKAVFGYYQAGQNLSLVDESDWEKETWYQFEDNTIVGGYAETDDGLYYIYETPDLNFYGFYVPKRLEQKADRIMDEVYEYLTGESEDWPEETFKGKVIIRDMFAEEEELYLEWFNDAEFDSADMRAVKTKTIYFVTPMQYLGVTDKTTGFISGVILVLGGLVLLLFFLLSGGKKSVKKELQKLNLSENVLEADMNAATKIGNYYIGQRFLAAANTGISLVPFDRLVWAYKQTTTTRHTLYGIIPTGTTKSYSLVFYDRDGKAKNLSVKKDQMADEILRMVAERAPHIIFGYSDELARFAKTNFHAMVEKVEENKLRPADVQNLES